MVNRDRLMAIILASIGLGDSIYLSWIKLSHNEALCIKGIGDCWSVNNSIYAEWNGIPIALFGALAYLFVILILVLEQQIKWLARFAVYILFMITLVGTIYSAYLTYLEIAVIKAICPYCVLSALVMLALFILTSARLIRTVNLD